MAGAWLYGSVDTDVPGYRQIKVGGGSVNTAAAGYYVFPDWLDEMSGLFPLLGYIDFDVDAGLPEVKLTPAATVTWQDRASMLLGFDSEPGDVELSAGTHTAREHSPACIPLYSATWDDVEVTADEIATLDRQQRAHGYVFGGARLWTWRLRMSAAAHRAFSVGWCLSGQVTIAAEDPVTWIGGGLTPWSSTNTGGYVQGHIVGIKSANWLDDTRQAIEVVVVLATERS